MKKEQEIIIPIHVTLVSFGLMVSVRSQIGSFSVRITLYGQWE